MKPRAFIGSSIEGLNIAYAVQQNLLHDAEVTVWDQGVFVLSATTIESLMKAITNTDFGIFVFSPDDTLRMRSADTTSVRDNVLFEFGLFVGKLGRERVFFLVPSSSPPQIPTDLLGITPAKYETDRADGSMQAATGPACHQMRQQMKALGALSPSPSSANLPGEEGKAAAEKREWFLDFIDKRYVEAKATLEASLPEREGNDAIETKAWIHYCDFKLDEQAGLEKLLTFASEYGTSAVTQKWIAGILRRERYTERAIQLLDEVDPTIRDHPAIRIALSECYVANEEPDRAIALLSEPGSVADPDVALALAGLLEAQERQSDALRVVHVAYMQSPRHMGLRFKYARLTQELETFPIAAYFLDGLALEERESIDYWGYLGNACHSLGLRDRALASYRKAEALLKPTYTDQWIISNIGNLFNNVGLPSEAIGYFNRAIEGEPESDFAHERLALALKKKEEGEKEYRKKIAEGLRMVKAVEEKRRAPDDGPGETPTGKPGA